MHQRKEEGNFSSMTRNMLDYYRLLEKLEGSTEPEFLEIQKSIIENIDSLIKQLSDIQFFKFAYYLRQYDVKGPTNPNKSDHFTKALLQGKLKQPLLYDIVIANVWSKEKKTMEVSNEHAYNIFGGINYEMTWKCNKEIQTYQWPYTMKEVSNDQKTGSYFDNMTNFVK